MTAHGPRATLRVRSARPNPERVGHHDRWRIACEVLRSDVDTGTGEPWPEDLRQIELRVHSPSKTFLTTVEELPGQIFHVELESPVGEAYGGRIHVLARETP